MAATMFVRGTHALMGIPIGLLVVRHGVQQSSGRHSGRRWSMEEEWWRCWEME